MKMCPLQYTFCLCIHIHDFRQYGAIPVLVKQLRSMDTRVQIAILGALRNLSFGRTNEQNKVEIAGEHGLTEILLALKKSRVAEVRELLTSVLWNLSSSQVGVVCHVVFVDVMCMYICVRSHDKRDTCKFFNLT